MKTDQERINDNSGCMFIVLVLIVWLLASTPSKLDAIMEEIKAMRVEMEKRK